MRNSVGALPGLARFRDAEATPTAIERAAAPAPVPAASDGLLTLTPERIELARIEVAPVQGGELGRHITAPGTVAPAGDRIARVPARVGGTVAELRKRLNDTVAKGEVVAVLDSREVADARSEHLSAAVNAELQKTMADRAKTLWDKRIIAEEQFLQARAAAAEATLRSDLSRQKLLALGLDVGTAAESARAAASTQGAVRSRQYEVRSPAAGRVVERKVELGTSVGQLDDLYTIVDLSRVWVELAVSTAELPLVRDGQAVAITGADGARTEGKVVFVSPFLDKDTRSARVVAEIANPDEAWRPGSYVTADIALGGHPARALVPRSALQTIAGKPAVFVRTPEGFQMRPVTIGRSDHRAVEVTAGVEPGESVAVGNSFALKAELGRAQLAE